MNTNAIHIREARPRAIRLRSLARFLPAIFALVGLLQFAPATAQDATKLVGGTINIFAGSKDLNASQTYDGVAANASQIIPPSLIAQDSDGNLYFSYAQGTSVGVSVIYGGTHVPPLLALRVPAPQKGYQYRVAGTLSPTLSDPVCAPPDACGDGGPALAPSGSTNPLVLPFGLAVDANGNLYIADEAEQCIRKVSATDGAISTLAGDPMHAQFGYSGDGGPAASALFFNPTALKIDSTGKLLYVADAINSVVRRIDLTSGTITPVAGNTAAAAAAYANAYSQLPFDCSVSTDNCGEGGDPLSATLGFVDGMSFDSNGNLFLAESDINVVREIDFSAASPKMHTVAGTLRMPCDPSSTPQCGDSGAAVSAFLNSPTDVQADASGNVVISDALDNAVRLVTASDGTIQTIAGQISATGGYGGDGGPARAAQLNIPYGLALDSAGNLYVADQINSLIREIAPPTGLLPYTITFPAISAATYGTKAIALGATVDQTGQPVASYRIVSGPGTISGSSLVVTGAGTITVEADQPADSSHSAATPVTQKVTIAQATLTVTADSLSRAPGAANPPLTYTIAGFVNGDTISVVSGAPVLSTTATTSSPFGSYPITVAKGTLSAVNYTFAFVDGVLNVTQGSAQTITFGSLSNVKYGASAITLHATASSGLPVTFAVSGPAQIQGSTLVVTGAGAVVVTADQAGNAAYAAAPTVTQSFTVSPAPLTVTPVNVSRTYNTPNPAFTYTVNGLVGGDTTAVLSGAPLFSTTATPTSDVGNYPITITQGNLFSPNYSFTFGTGTLTVTKAAQVITFGDVRDTAYTQSETVTASASSGLLVQYTATGPVTVHPASDGSLVTVSPTDLGTVTITATQAGSQNYSAAPAATFTFNVVKAEANVLVQSVSRAFGAGNPTFQYQIKLFPGDQAPDPITPPYFTGTPEISTTATESSPPGTYDIVAAPGSLTAEHYFFTFTNGTLTVTSASTYIMTTTPTALTIPRGATRQLTVTLTPVNNYVGSVTLGCSGLPAGITCGFSPASLAIPAPDPGSSSAQPVQGTLTISANGGTALSARPDISTNNRPVAASFLLLPAGLGGLLLLVCRRRFLKSVRAQNMLVFIVLLGIVSLMACGGGSKLNQPVPGNSVIQITGSGTPSPGASTLDQSVSLSLTIQ